MKTKEFESEKSNSYDMFEIIIAQTVCDASLFFHTYECDIHGGESKIDSNGNFPNNEEDNMWCRKTANLSVYVERRVWVRDWSIRVAMVGAYKNRKKIRKNWNESSFIE